MKKKVYTTPDIKEIDIVAESQLMVTSPSGPGTGDLNKGDGSNQSARYDMVIDDDDSEW